MVDAGQLNPLSGVNLGGSLGTFGSIALVIAIVVIILAVLGIVIYVQFVKRQYFIKIHVFRMIGNVPTRVMIHVAKPVGFGMAGDQLWRVAPNKALQKPFKIVKWLPVGKIQTAPNEYWYFIRPQDNEWINFSLSDISEIQSKAGVKFVSEDMRLQRLATERLLEQRLLDKTFWEKWGTTIMLVIVFLVIAVCMVIIFYQFSKVIDKVSPLVDTMDKGLKILVNECGKNYVENSLNQTNGGLIPANG